MSSFFDVNHATWDERANLHLEDPTGFYGVERFLAGEDLLFPIEAAEIGDIAGLNALHLQCHIGIETLCLARRGARVTGLDFSENALRNARELAVKAKIEARFVLGDVYNAPALVGGNYDLVYATWGTINWLPDIRRWGEVVAAVLKPGGRFYFAEGHPSFVLFDEVGGKAEPTFNWRTPSTMPLEFNNTFTYTGDTRPLANPRTHEWIHPLSDIFMALIDNGMQIRRFAEHEALPWPMFPSMKQDPDRLFRLPPGMPRLPLSFSLDAVKAG